MSLGDRIRSAREAAGLSREELAAQIGVSTKTISNWEADRLKRGPLQKLGLLEKVLGVQLRESSDRRFQGVSLDDATDTELIAKLGERLAEKDRTIRALRAQLEQLTAPVPLRPDVDSGRLVARPRELRPVSDRAHSATNNGTDPEDGEHTR